MHDMTLRFVRPLHLMFLPSLLNVFSNIPFVLTENTWHKRHINKKLVVVLVALVAFIIVITLGSVLYIRRKLEKQGKLLD